MSNAVPPSVRRPRRGALLALVLVSVLALGACTHQRTIPDQYGDTTEGNFTDGCVEALRQRGADPDGIPEADLGESEPFTAERARAVCTCAYEGISGEGGISFERFKEITEAQEDEPAALPDEITTIVDGCVESNPA